MKYIISVLLLVLTGRQGLASDWLKLRASFDDEDLCPETLAAVGEHAHLFEVLARGNEQVFEELWESDPFQKFLLDHPTSADGPYDDPSLIKTYLDEGLARFDQSPALIKHQGQWLKEGLKIHGAKPGRFGGYKALATLSADNQSRLLEAFPYTNGTPGMEHAESLVATLKLAFSHNAPREVKTPRFSLLSSAALETLGFSGGLNTSAFNRWLRSDEHVFFFVDFYLDRDGKRVLVDPADQERRRYGEFQCELNWKYANERSWLSLYVMDIDELIDFGRLVHPDEYEAISKLIVDTYQFRLEDKKRKPFESLMDFVGHVKVDDAWDFVSQTPGLTPLLESLRNKLSRFDFVPEDFRSVLRQTLLNRLNNLRLTDPASFTAATQTLATGNSRELRILFNTLIFTPLNIPNDFEVKVPVAVPVQGILPGN